MERQQVGKTNKTAGSNAERYYASLFRELGFKHCLTARFASKLHDNAKIDLINLPFNIQIKYGKQKGMNAGKELFLMASSIEKMFPEDDPTTKKPLLLIHKLRTGKGVKRTPEHEKIFMSLKQFNIFKSEFPNLEYETVKEYKYDLKSEYKIIVSMKFETFKNQIIKEYAKNWNREADTTVQGE
jgi:hypothetical protein